MPLVDPILPWLYSQAKKNRLLKRVLRPIYALTSQVRSRIRAIGGKAVVYPTAVSFIASTETWLDSDSGVGQFQALDPAFTQLRDLPRTIEKDVHWKYIQGRSHEHPSTFVARIPEGRVADQGFVLTRDNQLLAEVSKVIVKADYSEQYAQHPLLRKSLPPVTRMAGKLAVLAVPYAGTNYYHWMLDLLPRLWLLEKAGISQEEVDYYLVNDTASRFQRETLQTLGIPRKKILSTQWYPHLQADELIIPSLSGDTGNFARERCEWIREKFSSDSTVTPFRKLYLNRRKVSYRKIPNESVLEDKLIKLGFESIDPENYSVAEQARLFSEASCIISPHGAALTNLVFCQPGTKVIELLHPASVNTMFWALSETMGLEYHYLLGAGKRPLPGSDPYDNFANFEVPVESIVSMLQP